MEFSEKEFDIIIEALSSLPSKDIPTQMLSTVLMAMATPNKEDIESLFERRQKAIEETKLASLEKEIVCKQIMQRFLSMKDSIVVPNKN